GGRLESVLGDQVLGLRGVDVELDVLDAEAVEEGLRLAALVARGAGGRVHADGGTGCGGSGHGCPPRQKTATSVGACAANQPVFRAAFAACTSHSSVSISPATWLAGKSSNAPGRSVETVSYPWRMSNFDTRLVPVQFSPDYAEEAAAAVVARALFLRTIDDRSVIDGSGDVAEALAAYRNR